MRRILLLLTAAALAAGYFVLSALPASGETSGQVTASVQVDVAAPCITLDNTAISFGTLPFSTATSIYQNSGSPDVTYTNCSSRAEQIFVRGSDATGTGNALWGLVSDAALCPNLDRFNAAVWPAGDEAGRVNLTTSEQLLRSTDAGASQPTHAYIWMPCTGSTGAGQLMTMSINFTAVF